jgi:hypothetical protein
MMRCCRVRSSEMFQDQAGSAETACSWNIPSGAVAGKAEEPGLNAAACAGLYDTAGGERWT